jgi:luciferase family oxidoreductase group 1
MKLSILDQSVAASGRTQAQAMVQTLELAALAENLGYHRFWVSEHHSHPGIVGTAPEVLLAALAMRTRRIRLGSAGVMLPHYSALKVAEQFRVLDALAPGRIDLGVGRAPGSDGRTAQLLNPDRYAAENFPQQVIDLCTWVTGATPAPGHPGHGVWACPSGPTQPDVWMLGSSDYGAQLAAHLGLPYAFAYFITDGQGAEQALQLYRQNFRPGVARSQPQAVVCVWALVADTEQQAWQVFQSRARWRLDRESGRLGPLLPPEEALRALSPEQESALERLKSSALVGTAPQVAEQLQALAGRLGVDELAVITWTHDPRAQRRSFELLAQEMGLARAHASAIA